MSKIWLKSLLLSSSVLGMLLLSVASSIAAPTSKNTKSQLQFTQTKDLAPNLIKIIYRDLKAIASTPKVPEADADPVFSTTITTKKELITQNFVTRTKQLVASKLKASVAQANMAPIKNPSATLAIPAASSSASVSFDPLDRANLHSNENKTNDSLAQVTSVSQLSDVQPTDWTFQALQSLVERYGCIAGYPDNTFAGNRVLTRYEFAAGLNACLDRVNELIATATAESVTKEDLATIQRLQAEFSSELTNLRGRVDALEAQTAELEANQFSTTTKLSGEVILAVSGAFGNDKAVPSGVPTSSASKVDENFTLSERAILNFETSFTGEDSLIVSLYANNNPDFLAATGTSLARLIYEQDSGGSTNNQLAIFYLSYGFPIGKRLKVLVEPYGGVLSDFVDRINPLLGNVGNGSISAFGNRNPIYWISSFGAGAGFTYDLSKAVSLSLGYLATDANDTNSGLFSGPYGAIAQLTLRPSETINLGLTYVRSYNGFNDINVGSTYAKDPFDGNNSTANSYGLEANFQISPKFAIGGWAGYTQAKAVSGVNEGAKATIFNYAVTLAFPDLFKEGNLGGVVVGLPPKVTSNDINDREDNDSSLHLEAFYRFQLTKNIGITPGVLVITNPEHNKDNDTVYLGTIRTTFSF